MTQQEEWARAIIAMARVLAGETVDGLCLKDEDDHKLALLFARSIRRHATNIEKYIVDPM